MTAVLTTTSSTEPPSDPPTPIHPSDEEAAHAWQSQVPGASAVMLTTIPDLPAQALHLAGLVTRAVARPLQITQLLELFNTYPTLSHALTALTD